MNNKRVDALEKEIENLKSLLSSMTCKAQPVVGSFIKRDEIKNVMSWNKDQWDYNKKKLAPYGLVKTGGFKMPYAGFIAFLEESGMKDCRVTSFLK